MTATAGPSTSIQFDEASLTQGKNNGSSSNTRRRVESNQSSIMRPSHMNTATCSPPDQTRKRYPSSVSSSATPRIDDNAHRRKVITKPAWVQADEDEDDNVWQDEPPPQKAATAGGTLPKNWAPGQQSAAGPSSSSSATSPPPATKDDELKSPARFWTFTLPTKYRNRLHEHHLRMLRNEIVERDSAHGRARRRSLSSSRSSSSSHSSSSGSDSEPCHSDEEPQVMVQGLSGAVPPPTNTDTATGQRRKSHPHSNSNRRQRRSSGGGLGDVLASAGAAAGLGGQDSLIGWRRRQEEQRQHTTTTTSPLQESSPDESSEGQRTRLQLGDEESQTGPRESYEKVQALPATEMKAKIPLYTSSDASLTRHQNRTPGWESPWQPEETTGVGAIDVGGYTFATGGTGDGFFPRTDTRRSNASSVNGKLGRKRRRRVGQKNGQTNPAMANRTRNGMLSLSEKHSNTTRQTNTSSGEGWWQSKWEWWKGFLMRNPFVPLLFRAINISFTAATLAVAIRLWRVLHVQGAANAVGSSPVVGIIFAPLSLIHVGAQVWLEYFSRPIGLWAVKSKLSYQLIELVFISLWSAELALTFDNYATSSLVCVNWYSPYTTTGGCSVTSQESPLRDVQEKPYICRLQGALIGLTFTTLLAYVAVFAVSLFRTVVR
ncbi:unnamed protein product [Sympodiomycopsis kandeliae]